MAVYVAHKDGMVSVMRDRPWGLHVYFTLPPAEALSETWWLAEALYYQGPRYEVRRKRCAFVNMVLDHIEAAYRYRARLGIGTYSHKAR